jgi:hypothetical protein
LHEWEISNDRWSKIGPTNQVVSIIRLGTCLFHNVSKLKGVTVIPWPALNGIGIKSFSEQSQIVRRQPLLRSRFFRAFVWGWLIVCMPEISKLEKSLFLKSVRHSGLQIAPVRLFKKPQVANSDFGNKTRELVITTASLFGLKSEFLGR